MTVGITPPEKPRVSASIIRSGLRVLRAPILRMDGPWRHLVVAAFVGVLGACAVAAFRAALFTLESLLVGAQGGHLVAAARALDPLVRFAAPAAGGLVAGLLLWLAERRRQAPPGPHGGDYIEAVAIGRGRLDLRAGGLKVVASLLVVSTGGAIGREGAMVLLAAMLASVVGRVLGRSVSLRLVVSCGAAAGLAAAYQAPLAGAVFVAEILLGSLALAQLGPVIVSAVMAYGITALLGGSAVLFPVASSPLPDGWQLPAILLLSLVAGALGSAFLRWLESARALFERVALPLPLAFALGGLVVGLLSLWRPEVWGNGYSSISHQLGAADPIEVVALVLLLKAIAVAATTGSGAPGGVFTPTLFVGAGLGALAAGGLHALGVVQVIEPVYAVLGMALLLAATTHAPVMAALMVVEMTGRHDLLALLLPACVVAAQVSRRLHPLSVYGLGPGPQEAVR
ncbi:MAG: chloride channel protein [Rhizobacter sp.]|nr:chloride channel protein [Rhizobacter sp.]